MHQSPFQLELYVCKKQLSFVVMPLNGDNIDSLIYLQSFFFFFFFLNYGGCLNFFVDSEKFSSFLSKLSLTTLMHLWCTHSHLSHRSHSLSHASAHSLSLPSAMFSFSLLIDTMHQLTHYLYHTFTSSLDLFSSHAHTHMHINIHSPLLPHALTLTSTRTHAYCLLFLILFLIFIFLLPLSYSLPFSFGLWHSLFLSLSLTHSFSTGSRPLSRHAIYASTNILHFQFVSFFLSSIFLLSASHPKKNFHFGFWQNLSYNVPPTARSQLKATSPLATFKLNDPMENKKLFPVLWTTYITTKYSRSLPSTG